MRVGAAVDQLNKERAEFAEEKSVEVVKLEVVKSGYNNSFREVASVYKTATVEDANTLCQVLDKHSRRGTIRCIVINRIIFDGHVQQSDAEKETAEKVAALSPPMNGSPPRG